MQIIATLKSSSNPFLPQNKSHPHTLRMACELLINEALDLMARCGAFMT
jgi:hypothetical protein